MRRAQRRISVNYFLMRSLCQVKSISRRLLTLHGVKQEGQVKEGT